MVQSRYVETGRLVWTLHPYPLETISAAGFMLARCAGERASAVVADFFRNQGDLLNGSMTLRDLAARHGVSEGAYRRCMADRPILEGLRRDRAYATDVVGVQATPTFFVGGRKIVGVTDRSDFLRAIDAAVAPVRP